MKDVCFDVLEIKHSVLSVFVKGTWWNIAFGEPYPMGSGRQLATETIKISRLDWPKWKFYKRPEEARKAALDAHPRTVKISS